MIHASWLVLLIDKYPEPEPPLPASLVFLNMKQITTDDGKSADSFFFDLTKHNLSEPTLISDQGVYRPSHGGGSPTPFYPDASQRVLVVGFDNGNLVITIEALLELAQERKSAKIGWEEWEAHARWMLPPWKPSSLWVSGPLVFRTYSNGSEETSLDGYDFSARASAGHKFITKNDTVKELLPRIKPTLPWELDETDILYVCHNSISFVVVRTPRSSNPA